MGTKVKLSLVSQKQLNNSGVLVPWCDLDIYTGNLQVIEAILSLQPMEPLGPRILGMSFYKAM